MPDPDMRQVGFLLETEILPQHWGKDMDKYCFAVKQWCVITHACTKSNVKVKDVNNG